MRTLVEMDIQQAKERRMAKGDGTYTVFEGSAIEAAFPATAEGWAMALAYRDDTLAKYDAATLAAVGVKD